MAQAVASIPHIGPITPESGLKSLSATSDGRFEVGTNGVQAVATTGDGKVEFIGMGENTLAHVRSGLGYPAYYPVEAVRIERPISAVLMDLDGTTIRSESFWIWIIEKTTASLLDDTSFRLEEADFSYVSGHSVSEHLTYCINKYCPDKTVEEARKYYFQHTYHEMDEIMAGRGREGAFTPSPGIKPFLLNLKERGIKIGLVTSGLYEKAWPEILDGFRTLDLGDPKEFYDAIITAGFPLRKGRAGTLGELSPKPHPWLYAETACVGLGLKPEERHHVVGIEDSGAGVASVRLAGFSAIGLAGGNIIESGTRGLCEAYCETFEEITTLLFD